MRIASTAVQGRHIHSAGARVTFSIKCHFFSFNSIIHIITHFIMHSAGRTAQVTFSIKCHFFSCWFLLCICSYITSYKRSSLNSLKRTAKCQKDSLKTYFFNYKFTRIHPCHHTFHYTFYYALSRSAGHLFNQLSSLFENCPKTMYLEETIKWQKELTSLRTLGSS